MGRLGGVLLVVLLGCSSSGGVSEGDRVFLEGREVVEVFRLMPPEGFDAEATLVGWAEFLGIEDREFGVRVGETPLGLRLTDRGGVNDRGDEMVRRVGISFQTGSFSFGFTGGNDPNCDRCGAATLSAEEAVVRTQGVFVGLGFDVDDFVWSGEVFPAGGPQEAEHVWVEAQRVLDGAEFGEPFRARFADGDVMFSLRGSVYVPVSRGVVGLLSPLEALAQESEVLALEVPVESLESAVLGWEVSFDRFSLVSLMVPVWRFALNAELGLSSSVLAIRAQDVPSE
jgi:hypothetical protein